MAVALLGKALIFESSFELKKELLFTAVFSYSYKKTILKDKIILINFLNSLKKYIVYIL